MANAFVVQGNLLFQAPTGSSFINPQVSIGVSTVPTGSTFLQTVATINTTETTPNTATVPAIGYVFFRNNDPTNFVQIGSATNAYSINLAPGDVALAKWNSNAIFAKANTAAVALQIVVISA